MCAWQALLAASALICLGACASGIANPDAPAADGARADAPGSGARDVRDDGFGNLSVAIDDAGAFADADPSGTDVDPPPADDDARPEAGQAEPVVPAPRTVLLLVAPTSAARVLHDVANFTATLLASDGTTRDVTKVAIWLSSSPDVASIDEEGVATALAVGATEISASLGALTTVAPLTVTAPVLSGVAATPVAAIIALDGTQAFKATMVFSNRDIVDITTTVPWTSSQPEVADISNLPGSEGTATARSVGQTVIGFRMAGFSAQATLTVTPSVPAPPLPPP